MKTVPFGCLSKPNLRSRFGSPVFASTGKIPANLIPAVVASFLPFAIKGDKLTASKD